jgi:hypothetical protein
MDWKNYDKVTTRPRAVPCSSTPLCSGTMNSMKLLSFLGLALCALPALAQQPAPAAGSAALPVSAPAPAAGSAALPVSAPAPAAGSAALPVSAPAPAAGAVAVAAYPRRILAPCELTSATLSLTGEENPDQGRGFALHVMNRSARTLAMPSTPDFGWRVETLEKKGWTLMAEGGPVRRVSSSDPHLAVASQSVSGPMLQIAPTQSQNFRFFLPSADAALRPEARLLTTLRLTVYWAASAELAQSNRDVPPCAVAAEWIVTLQRP